MRRLLVVLAVVLVTGCGADDGPAAVTGTVTVLADTSLTDVLTQLGEQLEGDHPGLDVRFDFGASADLAERLTGGDRADVFAPAGTDPMDVVTDDGLVSRAPSLFATRQQAGALVGYPICTLTDAPNPDGALAFVQLVRSGAGQEALTAAGFTVP